MEAGDMILGVKSVKIRIAEKVNRASKSTSAVSDTCKSKRV
jgi:hypothetical protein